MLRLKNHRSQDEQIQGALRKLDAMRSVHAVPFYFYRKNTGLLSKWKESSNRTP
jgi:hypothetical protein